MSAQKKSFDDLDAVKVLVETLEKFNDEDKKRIIKWACEKLGTDIGYKEKFERSTVLAQTPEKERVNSNTSHLEKSIDIKTFVDSKNPKSDNQFATVVAYFYQFEANEKKDSITKTDLTEATRHAGWSRLKRPDQTLVNTEKAGYLDKVTGARGHYSLNSVGENLVAMVLPDGEKVKKNRRQKTPKKSLNRKKKRRKNKK